MDAVVAHVERIERTMLGHSRLVADAADAFDHAKEVELSLNFRALPSF
jgi:hypothetical protein